MTTTLQSAMLERDRRTLEAGAWSAAEEFATGAASQFTLRCGTEACDRSCCIGVPFALTGEIQIIAHELAKPELEQARKRVLAHDGKQTRKRCPLQNPSTGLCEVYDVRPFQCRVYLVPCATVRCNEAGCQQVDSTRLSDMAILTSYAGGLVQGLHMVLARYGFTGPGAARAQMEVERSMGQNRKQRRRSAR